MLLKNHCKKLSRFFMALSIKYFRDEKLEKELYMRKIGKTDFSTKPTNYYNLDVIISVGYSNISL